MRVARIRSARRALVTLALASLAVGVSGSEFEGCEGGSDVDAGPLPPSTGCLVNADCVSEDMCVELMCASGECVPAGPANDLDGDGFAPAPCGTDCDDTDADIFPGGAERCDGRDEDCDGRIDEDALGVEFQEILDGLRDAQVIGLDDGYAVFGFDGAVPGLFMYRTDGGATALGAPVPLDTGTTAASDFALARNGPNVVLFVTDGPVDPPQRLELQASGDILIVVDGPTPFGDGFGASQIASLVALGQEWALLDRPVAGGLEERLLWRSGAPGLLTSLGSSAEVDRPALATDATYVVATISERELGFFDANATQVATQTLAGAFADGPIASGDGFVFALYRDAFDHLVTTVSTAGSEAPSVAPSGGMRRADDVSITAAGPNLLFVRRYDSGVLGWLMESDLMTYTATFGSGELTTDGGAPASTSVTRDDRGVSAVLSSYTDRSTLAVLSCGGR